MSKIAQALELVKAGKNPHAAAVAVGLRASAVYARLKKERSKTAGVCSCCGAPVNADGKYQ